LIDWFDRRQVTIDRDLHIYSWIDIAIFMNWRILTKYSENLYSDSSLICENRNLWFCILELLQNVITSLSELQIMCFIYPFWSFRWGLHHGDFKYSIWVHIIVVWSTSSFIGWNSTKLSENTRITWKAWLYGPTYEIYKIGLHLKILIIL
jgi:hypothetical protein